MGTFAVLAIYVVPDWWPQRGQRELSTNLPTSFEVLLAGQVSSSKILGNEDTLLP